MTEPEPSLLDDDVLRRAAPNPALEHRARSQSRRGPVGRLVRGLAIASAVFLVVSVGTVGVLRWVNPPTSAVILAHWLSAHLDPDAAPPYVHQQWVDWRDIPPQVVLAAIAAEDQRFPEHAGFDVVEMRKAWEGHLEGERLRGASTISQQTAKNLFLWSGRDYVRKGLEAWFTLLIEGMWPKQRIMEVYLNIAQFGPDTYGVGAASWRYLKRPIVSLRSEQAALLAAVLPNPNVYRLDNPSARVQQRAAWIKRQMRQLGGTDYLHSL